MECKPTTLKARNFHEQNLQKAIETIQNHMEEGTLVWHCPYIVASQANLVSHREYQGINHFVTAIVSMKEGYSSPYWATFLQIKELGGSLKDAKGKGVPILFYKDLESVGEGDDKKRFVARHSCVFNLDLVTGIDIDAINVEATGDATHDADADLIVRDYLERENIGVSSGSPAYIPSLDRVRMPDIGAFCSQDEFYSTYFHELSHSTGSAKRLFRFDAEQVKFESKEDYSREELVAEITSAMICHGCGLDSKASIKNSAAYIQGWSRFIRDEGQAFVTAINQAYRARALILDGEGA